LLSDEYDLAPFVGEPIEHLLDSGAPLALSSARVCKHVDPPFFAPGALAGATTTDV